MTKTKKSTKKAPFSAKVSSTTPKKDEFTEKSIEKPKIVENGPSEHVSQGDSAIVRSFWLQKEKLWKKGNIVDVGETGLEK
jgi:hypothetical protein